MRIVRELGVESRGETLTRWLAHHLAEVILAAERAEGPEREAAQRKAVELTLKIWSHRRVVPYGVNPLAELEDVIAVLRSLKPGAWLDSSAPVSHALLKRAFIGLQEVVSCGTLLAARRAGKVIELGEREGFLSSEEEFVVGAIKAWEADLKSAPILVVTTDDESSSDGAGGKPEYGASPQIDAEARARGVLARRIDGLIESLGELRAELTGS